LEIKPDAPSTQKKTSLKPSACVVSTIEEQSKKVALLEGDALQDYRQLTPVQLRQYIFLLDDMKYDGSMGKRKPSGAHLKNGMPLLKRRIDRANRLIYSIKDSEITVWGILGHDDTIERMERQGLLR